MFPETSLHSEVLRSGSYGSTRWVCVWECVHTWERGLVCQMFFTVHLCRHLAKQLDPLGETSSAEASYTLTMFVLSGLLWALLLRLVCWCVVYLDTLLGFCQDWAASAVLCLYVFQSENVNHVYVEHSNPWSSARLSECSIVVYYGKESDERKLQL